MLPPPPDPRSSAWIRKHKQRHDCADNLPPRVPDDVDTGDKWRCPACRRRWTLAWIGKPDAWCTAAFAEGVTIKGPDGSVYWRAWRMRFLGAFPG